MTNHHDPQTPLDRRTLLKGATAAGLASALEPLAGAPTLPSPRGGGGLGGGLRHGPT